jgi:hypothetical protein
MISPNRMVELLSKVYELSDQIPPDLTKELRAVKFTWNKELTEYYKEERDINQMFRYSYNNSHELKFLVPEIFEQPKEFKGTAHPKLIAPRGQDMTIIWRLVPVKGEQILDIPGFPKYIMEKKYFPNSEPVFQKY